MKNTEFELSSWLRDTFSINRTGDPFWLLPGMIVLPFIAEIRAASIKYGTNQNNKINCDNKLKQRTKLREN